MKIRFIAREATREFKYGEILEARKPQSETTSEWYAITNKYGEHYAYPAEWFELVEE